MQGMDSALANIRIVLVEPTHPGNIGAAARAMKTMGLSRLALVRPKVFPSAEATAMASGADDLLVGAQVCGTLGQALAGCALAVATSARARRIPWPAQPPREAAARIIEAARQAEVAVVFGREHAGLTNEELELCQAVTQIPTDAQFSSLNLAAAVQVIAYELRSAALSQAGPQPDEPAEDARMVASEDMERLYAHLEQIMIEVGFLDPDKPRRLMRRLRRLFARTGLDAQEYNILRGFLTAVQAKLRE